MDDKELFSRFSSHKMSDNTKNLSEYIRTNTFNLSQAINTCCPDSREKDIALTKLEECLFWSNAALARNQQ